MPDDRQTFLKLEDSLWDLALNALSAMEFLLLVDFLYRWRDATVYGTRQITAVPFTWGGSRVRCWRETFDKARAELITLGFIEVVNKKLGTFCRSEKWRKHDLTSSARPEALETARRRQCLRTSHYRAASRTGSDQKPGTAKRAAESVSGNQSLSQCPETRHPVVTGKQSHKEILERDPPPPTSSSSDVAPGDPAVGGGESIQPWWPPPAGMRAAEFHMWAERAWRADVWTEEQRSTVAQMCRDLKDAEQRARLVSNPLLKPLDGLPKEDAVCLIAKGLGDNRPRAQQRVRDVVQEYGVKNTQRGAVQLLEEGASPVGCMKWLGARAKGFANASR